MFQFLTTTAYASYVNRARSGEDYILWNQKVRWFAKSSGTSSDKSKFIPVTEDSLKFMHFKGMTSMLANYINTYPDSQALCREAHLTLGGSVKPDEMGNGSVTYTETSPQLCLRTRPLLLSLPAHQKEALRLLQTLMKK
jgi:hypothetical protein